MTDEQHAQDAFAEDLADFHEVNPDVPVDLVLLDPPMFRRLSECEVALVVSGRERHLTSIIAEMGACAPGPVIVFDDVDSAFDILSDRLDIITGKLTVVGQEEIQTLKRMCVTISDDDLQLRRSDPLYVGREKRNDWAEQFGKRGKKSLRGGFGKAQVRGRR